MKLEERLKTIVGANNFFAGSKDLEPYSKDYSFAPKRMPNYLVKPRSAEEVSEIIKLANETKTPVIPVSSGIHFYGGIVPRYGGIVMDLSKMDRIIRIDARNRKVLIEPGVTWKQLQSELAKHGLMALNPLLPPATKSALTSILDREPPLVTKFEHSDPIMAMRMVLPTGEIFATGSACVPGALASDGTPVEGVDLCHPYGPGINWFRLIQGAQGTLGVVLWVNIKLTYLPTAQEIYLIPFETIGNAVEYMYKVLRRMIGHECFLLNRFNLANILAEKWPEDFEELMATLPPFTLVLVLAGGYRRPEEKIEYERNYLNRIGPELTMNLLPVLSSRIVRRFQAMLRASEEVSYWKIRYKGSFQDVFFLTTMDKTPRFTSLVCQLAAKHGYPSRDVGIYIQPIEYGRCAHFECSFFYDPEDQKDVERVRGLYHEMVERSIDLGAFFSRPYDYAAEVVFSRATEYTAALRRIKNVIDPNNIMNPGKLCF